jgi:single-strand DNA-binding protein
MFNHSTLVGRIVADPEVKTIGDNISVCSFRLAVDRQRKDAAGERQVDFIDCVAWRQSAEFMGKYVQKGRLLLVDGHIQVREWQDKEGQKRRTVEVVAENVRALDRPKDDAGRGAVNDIADPFADQ